MVSLKYFKYYTYFLLFFSCNKYDEDKQIYQLITIENWKSKGNVSVKMYHYKKQTNFSKMISVDSLFEVTNDTIHHYLTITPKFINNKPIDDDLILLVNKDLEYRFTEVSFIKDTVKRPTILGHKYIIRYNLKANVNNKKINYLDTVKKPRQASYISLETSLARKMR
ncbi:hypothetical protein [Flavobacterium sp. HBTb2-11-1]|uniref:hypothetical protein n=1 Tax=Flavobacterium sp. HBTb2-11-1 TaxID=2692212 RepID=UPI00136C3A47|nr:hypothetical protein [Flavobacterium sp. HBTb2-11-1]MXO05630.1 hypothetical protein [Flavobacterium sp. HBTb2-11-1]